MGYTFGEFEVGQKFNSAPVTMTQAHTLLLGSLIHNWHPSHVSSDYSSRGPFGQNIIHGELTHALSVGGFSMFLTDTSLGQLATSYRLPAPLFVGDTIYTEIEVTAKRPSKKHPGGVVTFGLTTYKQDGTVVSEAEAVFLVANERFQVYSPHTPAGKAGASPTTLNYPPR